MKRRMALTIVGAAVALLIVAGVAAADRCHTPLDGTRSLTVNGAVTGYGFSGDQVLVRWARGTGCVGTIVWRPASAENMKPRTPCGSGGMGSELSAPEKLTASDARHSVRVVLAPAARDDPDRLVVADRSTGRQVAAWPLVERPARVALYGDVAILSGAARSSLYALRIGDGRVAQIGITRAGDSPVIGHAGVLYQTDLDVKKHRTAPSERTLDLVPLSSVEKELARSFTTVRKYMSYSRPAGSTVAQKTASAPAPSASYTGADPPRPLRIDAISSIAMDGPRVAMAVHDPSGRCDYVLFWNVSWHYVTRLTRANGPTCLPTHAAGGITSVAIAGSRAVWTVSYGGVTHVIAAGITDCQEWVVARPSRAQQVTGLTGDAGVLAYALSPKASSDRMLASVGVVPKFWRGIPILRVPSGISGLSTFDGDVAVLGRQGTVSITSRGGTLERRIATGHARAVALRPSAVTALTNRGTLDVFSRTSGQRLHSWRVPQGTRTLDVQYGTALLTTAKDVYAMSLATGRTAHLFHAPTGVAAQIEAPGAAIQFNLGGRGYVRFVPMSQIESSTR